MPRRHKLLIIISVSFPSPGIPGVCRLPALIFLRPGVTIQSGRLIFPCPPCAALWERHRASTGRVSTRENFRSPSSRRLCGPFHAEAGHPQSTGHSRVRIRVRPAPEGLGKRGRKPRLIPPSIPKERRSCTFGHGKADGTRRHFHKRPSLTVPMPLFWWQACCFQESVLFLRRRQKATLTH